MKKTVLALLLASTMAFAGTSAFAEEAAVELTYDMIDPEAFEGTWVTAFGVFDLYLPSDWTILVNAQSEEEVENNVYFQAANEEETQTAAISYAPSEYTDINDVAAAYAATEGMSDVEVININGIDAVSYEVATDEAYAAGVVALGDQGGLYNVTVGCTADQKDDFKMTAFNILVSFSATEAVEETEA